MEYRILGKTGLKVSLLSYGVYSLTGMYGSITEEEAIRILRKAWDLGINFYDTADVYGFGLGEVLLRKAFGDCLKDVVVATKVGYDFYSNPMTRRYDPGYLEFAVIKSMERLGKKPIDLLQVHNPPLDVLRQETLYRTLKRLVDEGIVAHIGVALGPEVNVLQEAVEALKHPEVEVVQFVYNMLEQQPGRTIAGLARRSNVGVIVRVPHAGGVLDETLKPGMEANLADHRSLRRREWFKWAYEVYRMYKEVLDGRPGTPGQKAIRFIIDSIEPHSIVLIARDVERLEDYVGALKVESLGWDVVAKIMEVHDREFLRNPELYPHSLT